MKQKKSLNIGRCLANSLKILALALFLLWTIVPILLVVLTSLKNQKDIFTVPPTFVFKAHSLFSVGSFGVRLWLGQRV
jgi:ABC-type glycerol-3-phosphate transport system permease component